MKKFTKSIAGVCLLGALVTLTVMGGCKKEPVSSGPAPGNPAPSIPPPPPTKVDPNDPNAVTEALIVDNGIIITGNIPAYQKPVGDSIIIDDYQSSVEVSAGGEIILPFNYEIFSQQGYLCKDYYIQVVGANKSIKVSKGNAPVGTKGTMIQRIRIPSRISFGGFCLTVGVTYVRADGSIYQPPTHTVCVTVSAPKTCGQFVSGAEGLTFTNLTLGNVAGTASINYDTYSIPDRLDIYYDGQWVAGTGTDPGPVPPQKNCSDVVPGDGFYGKMGTLSFAYDPAISKEVTVVVSGCLGSSTAWDYTVECPQ